MIFNSFHFVFFFIIVITMYYAIGHKYRKYLLLISSYYFYMVWNPLYVVLILFTTTVNYFCGIKIAGEKSVKKRKMFLIMGIVASLSVLFVFKYFNFFVETGTQLLSLAGLPVDPLVLNVLLPVGISFYTFQTLSYTIDVYRNETSSEKDFCKFALYVSFFPQLVAGPIERSANLLPQIDTVKQFSWPNIYEGLLRMLWGLFKKVVIADRLALFVDPVYDNVAAYSGWAFIIATVFFAFEIYCDFSGYSDIAVGAAQTLGFRLMENFNKPYFSKSMREFWSRWHISLSTWFRDYVYIPFGGNRGTKKRVAYNTFVTFLLSGLWHGATLTFAAWGAIHGLLLILERAVKAPLKKMREVMGLRKESAIRTFLLTIFIFLIVNLTWVFFRANTLPDAAYIFQNIFINLDPGAFQELVRNLPQGLEPIDFLLSFILIIGLVIIEKAGQHINYTKKLKQGNFAEKWLLIVMLAASIYLFGIYASNAIKPFVYFQF